MLNQKGFSPLIVLIIVLASFIGLYLLYNNSSLSLIKKKTLEIPNTIKNTVEHKFPPIDELAAPKPSPLISQDSLENSKITSCGIITKSGNYKVGNNLSSSKVCIFISNATDVSLDCQNFSITTLSDEVSIRVENSKNFSIKNCPIASKLDKPRVSESISILNSDTGNLENLTVSDGYLNVYKTDHLTLTRNTIHSYYQQNESSNNTLLENSFYSEKFAPGVVISNQGHDNTITNNKIHGGWDNVDHTDFAKYNGADDGIVFSWESNDIITKNSIFDIWDCGVESLGLIQNSQITDNVITNAGVCGVGAWYWNSWLQNTVSNNHITDSSYIFYFFRDKGLDPKEQNLYFKDNIFRGNTFTKQKMSSYIGQTADYSAYFAFTALPESILQSSVQIGNNLFDGNNFNPEITSPFITPSFLAIDKKNNFCKSINDSYYPLECH
jgi:hypothetical protein